MTAPNRAPFPYVGGKSRIAARVWAEFGDVYSYLEPFCGSAAVLLNRPETHARHREVIGDRNGYVINALRAIQQDSSVATARHAWHPSRTMPTSPPATGGWCGGGVKGALAKPGGRPAVLRPPAPPAGGSGA